MSVIYYDAHQYSADGEETVLDALLRHGVDFPHSCKIGTCQSCLIKLVSGQISPDAQKGLKPTLAAEHYFLACQCKPEQDLTVALPAQDDVAVASHVKALSMLSHNVLSVRLAIDNPSDFKAGQYINLVTAGNLIRSYSIANMSAEYIELHVKLVANGLMSGWLSREASVGSPIFIRGPMGECFYHNPDQQPFPIVLAGTGTGLAPLIGIARDALAKGHGGNIILIHGGVGDADLYLHDTLIALANVHVNFQYVPCVLNTNTAIRQASIDDVLVECLADIVKDVRLFICGPEAMTKKMKMKAFLAGVPSASIYSDAFVAVI